MVIITLGFVLSLVVLFVSLFLKRFVFGVVFSFFIATTFLLLKNYWEKSLEKSKEAETKLIESIRVLKAEEDKQRAEYDKLPKHLCIDGKEYIAHYYSLNPILAKPDGQIFEVVDNVSVPKKCSE